MGAAVETELVSLLAREGALRIIALSRIAMRSHTPNWCATDAEGRRFLVKLAPGKVVLARVEMPLAVHDLFPDRMFRLDGKRVYVLDWKEGRAKSLDALTAEELESLTAAHAAFCAALGAGRIHGDFNCNNVLFRGGKVSGILDLEAVRRGHPCEDWVRYALTGAEHLPVFAWRRRRRLAGNFSRLVASTGFAAADWRRAIDGFAAAKRARRARQGRLSFLTRVNLAWRARFYRRLEAALPREGGRVHG